MNYQAEITERSGNMLTCDNLNLIGKSFTELLSLFLCDIKDDDDYYVVLGFNLAKQFTKQFEFLFSSFQRSSVLIHTA